MSLMLEKNVFSDDPRPASVKSPVTLSNCL
jgi:hypothetical protein